MWQKTITNRSAFARPAGGAAREPGGWPNDPALTGTTGQPPGSRPRADGPARLEPGGWPNDPALTGATGQPLGSRPRTGLPGRAAATGGAATRSLPGPRR